LQFKPSEANSSRKTLHKNRAGGVAQGEGPELKPQYHKINRERETKEGYLYGRGADSLEATHTPHPVVRVWRGRRGKTCHLCPP
jgi:hypothetical protein